MPILIKWGNSTKQGIILAFSFEKRGFRALSTSFEHERKGYYLLEFEDVLMQYEPMISHSITKLRIYREHDNYR